MYIMIISLLNLKFSKWEQSGVKSNTWNLKDQGFHRSEDGKYLDDNVYDKADQSEGPLRGVANCLARYSRRLSYNGSYILCQGITFSGYTIGKRFVIRISLISNTTMATTHNWGQLPFFLSTPKKSLFFHAFICRFKK